MTLLERVMIMANGGRKVTPVLKDGQANGFTYSANAIGGMRVTLVDDDANDIIIGARLVDSIPLTGYVGELIQYNDSLLFWNGIQWITVSGGGGTGGAVNSVNGKIGNVNLTATDIPYQSTNVASALDTINDNILLAREQLKMESPFDLDITNEDTNVPLSNLTEFEKANPDWYEFISPDTLRIKKGLQHKFVTSGLLIDIIQDGIQPDEYIVMSMFTKDANDNIVGSGAFEIYANDYDPRADTLPVSVSGGIYFSEDTIFPVDVKFNFEITNMSSLTSTQLYELKLIVYCLEDSNIKDTSTIPIASVDSENSGHGYTQSQTNLYFNNSIRKLNKSVGNIDLSNYYTKNDLDEVLQNKEINNLVDVSIDKSLDYLVGVDVENNQIKNIIPYTKVSEDSYIKVDINNLTLPYNSPTYTPVVLDISDPVIQGTKFSTVASHINVVTSVNNATVEFEYNVQVECISQFPSTVKVALFKNGAIYKEETYTFKTNTLFTDKLVVRDIELLTGDTLSLSVSHSNSWNGSSFNLSNSKFNVYANDDTVNKIDAQYIANLPGGTPQRLVVKNTSTTGIPTTGTLVSNLVAISQTRNDISGASVSGDQIVLPSGSYEVKATLNVNKTGNTGKNLQIGLSTSSAIINESVRHASWGTDTIGDHSYDWVGNLDLISDTTFHVGILASASGFTYLTDTTSSGLVLSITKII